MEIISMPSTMWLCPLRRNSILTLSSVRPPCPLLSLANSPVSSGFDAAAGDRIGECLVSPDAYAHMTYMLKGLANGNLAVVLEGGYNLKSISASAVAVGKILLGETPKRIGNLMASHTAAETVDKVIKTQAPHWGCFRHVSYRLPCIVDRLKLNVTSLDGMYSLGLVGYEGLICSFRGD